MSEFHDAYERRVRKRQAGGEPAPLSADMEVARQNFQVDVLKAMLAEDPKAALDRAITEAASVIIAKAIVDLQAELARDAARETQKGHTMEPTVAAFAKGGGPTWAKIEAAAMAMVAKRGDTLSVAAAVDRYLSTSLGKRAYAKYLEEVDQVATAHDRARRAEGR